MMNFTLIGSLGLCAAGASLAFINDSIALISIHSCPLSSTAPRA